MTNNTIKILLSAMTVSLLSLNAVATDTTVRGSQLMTQQERLEQRVKMNAAQSPDARQQLRQEHHEQMEKRASERGLTLPDTPAAQGAGMRQGMGPGAGRGR
ncbi:MAG: hypothetical protein PHT48_13360 [Dechloromonas sp.]|nr:hypothetical protein [Dechloromonas sp.]